MVFPRANRLVDAGAARGDLPAGSGPLLRAVPEGGQIGTFRNVPSTQRDFASLRRRRLQAARLFAAGRLHLAAIARQLQVSRQSVTRWQAQWERGGSGALRGAGPAGRKPRPTELDLRRLRNALLRGPRAFGFPIASWTLPRVAELLHQTNGIRYRPGHVWKILNALDWTPRPRRPECGRRPVQSTGRRISSGRNISGSFSFTCCATGSWLPTPSSSAWRQCSSFSPGRSSDRTCGWISLIPRRHGA